MSSSHYSTKQSLFPLHGGCPCGLIRFALHQPPLLVHCCTCTACQRQTGTTFALNAIIESSQLTLLPAAAPSVPGTPANPAPLPAGLLPSLARTTGGTSVLAKRPAAGAPAPAPDLVTVPTESSLGQTLAQCPACHATLWNYYGDAGPHVAYVRVGTLDRAWEIEPDVHIYTRSRPKFLEVNDGKPQFEEYYEDRMALLRPEARERWEKLQDVMSAWRAEAYKDFAM